MKNNLTSHRIADDAARQARYGFTIVELLVVISIIGILAVMALIGLKASRGKAEDVRTKTNVRSIKNALEAYASENGEKYVSTNLACKAIYDGSDLAKALFPDGKVPLDRDGNPYVYCSDGDCYVVKAKMSDGLVHSFSDGTCNTTALTPTPPPPSPPATPPATPTPTSFIDVPISDSSAPVWKNSNLVSRVLVDRGSSTVKLIWSTAYDDFGFVRYKVKYSKVSANGPWTVVSPIYDTEVGFNSLDFSKFYYFKIEAYDISGNVAYGPTASVNLNSADISPPDLLSLNGFNCLNYTNKSSCVLAQKVTDNNGTVIPNSIAIRYKESTATSGWRTLQDDNLANELIPLFGIYKGISYDVQLIGTDNAGNYRIKEIYTICPSDDSQPLCKNGRAEGDIMAPVFSTDVSYNPNVDIIKQNGKYYLKWRAAGDDAGVKQYYIVVYNSSNQDVFHSYYNVGIGSGEIASGVTGGQTYHFDIMAEDYSGNWSSDGSNIPKVAP